MTQVTCTVILLPVPDIVLTTRGKELVHVPEEEHMYYSSFICLVEGMSSLDHHLLASKGGQWVSAHIDEIQASSEDALTLDEAFSAPISDLFYSMGFVSHRRKKTSNRSNKHLEDMNNYPTEASIDREGMQQNLPSDEGFEQSEGGDMDTTTSFSQSTEEELESLSEQGTDMQLTQSISPEEVSEKLLSMYVQIYVYLIILIGCSS